jgi:hypothetical protein
MIKSRLSKTQTRIFLSIWNFHSASSTNFQTYDDVVSAKHPAKLLSVKAKSRMLSHWCMLLSRRIWRYDFFNPKFIRIVGCWDISYIIKSITLCQTLINFPWILTSLQWVNHSKSHRQRLNYLGVNFKLQKLFRGEMAKKQNSRWYTSSSTSRDEIRDM